jgi:mycothiol synthase
MILDLQPSKTAAGLKHVITAAEPYSLRAPNASEYAILEAIWGASQDIDDPAFRPHDGWWSLADWAVMSRLLFLGTIPIGVVALNHVAEGDATEVRLALLPAYREAAAGARLLDAARELTRTMELRRMRLYVPSRAAWATRPAAEAGFRPVRALHAMLRHAGTETPPAPQVNGILVRPMRRGEEDVILAAINRAWEGTYNFHTISMDTFLSEVQNQRDSFLVAVDATDPTRIARTVHARFDPLARNPDGAPYAWVSNLTTQPEWRRRGLGRALLIAGLRHLDNRGAQSVALGVDGGNLIARRLYESLEFQTISTLEIWEGCDDGK